MMDEISTTAAPGGSGPFSQAIKSGDKVYVSGQGPIDSQSGEIPTQDPKEQVSLTLDNIESVLSVEDLSLSDVVKSTVFLTDMEIYDEVNEVYDLRFENPFPARSCVEVSRLPVDILVEIEVIAESA